MGVGYAGKETGGGSKQPVSPGFAGGPAKFDFSRKRRSLLANRSKFGKEGSG
jgi:hypothetical protein